MTGYCNYRDTFFNELVNSNCIITSTNQPKRDQLNILAYPNPYSSELNIIVETAFQEELHIEVTDLVGRQLFSQKFSVQKGLNSFVWNGLNASGKQIPSGIYILTVRSKDKIWSEKIVKQ